MSLTTPGDTATTRGQQCPSSAVGTVVCYLRTANPSTVGQRLLARQRAKLDVQVAVHGWTVRAWIEDLHQSGTTLQRPGLRQALALLADHQADALVATDTTHLAVDAALIGQLAGFAAEQGWQLLTSVPHPMRVRRPR